LSALSIADDPDDTAAAFHVHRSPLAAAIGLDALAPKQIASASMRIRESLIAEGYVALVSSWVSVLAGHCDRRSGLRLEKLVSLADAFEPRAGLRPSDFVRLAESALVEDPATARLRVMTIHRAKGLEFDAVIFPCLHRRMGDISRSRVVAHRKDPASPIDAVYRNPGSRLADLDRRIGEAVRQEKDRRLEDELCSLYVALTRARHALHIILPPLDRTAKTGDIGSKGFCDPSWVTLIRERLGAEKLGESFDGGETLHAAGDRNWSKIQHGRRRERAAGSEHAPWPPRIVPSVTGDLPRRSRRVIAPSRLTADGMVSARRMSGSMWNSVICPVHPPPNETRTT
jgi:hypothetical protein